MPVRRCASAVMWVGSSTPRATALAHLERGTVCPAIDKATVYDTRVKTDFEKIEIGENVQKRLFRAGTHSGVK